VNLEIVAHYLNAESHSVTNEDLIGLSDDAILSVVDDACGDLVVQAINLVHENRAGLVVLVPPASPPEVTGRSDGPVTSFVARWSAAKAYISDSPKAEQSCFRILKAACAGAVSLMPVSVLHRANSKLQLSSNRASSVHVVIPHVGREVHLTLSLSNLEGAGRVTVCYDGKEPPTQRKQQALKTGFELWWSPTNVGPYVIRHHFADTSQQQYVAFQDSDDMSLPGRLTLLQSVLAAGEADLVGSHELRLDELSEQVLAVRYPLDVNGAMSERARNAMLFPTTMLTSSFYKRMGGLSDDLRFALDTQFILRAACLGRLKNVDEFLYIRRIRAGSLTTDEKTGMQNALRAQLDRLWKETYFSVLHDGVSVWASALAPNKRSNGPVLMLRIRGVE
jgi:hypothetical protein